MDTDLTFLQEQHPYCSFSLGDNNTLCVEYFGYNDLFIKTQDHYHRKNTDYSLDIQQISDIIDQNISDVIEAQQAYADMHSD